MKRILLYLLISSSVVLLDSCGVLHPTCDDIPLIREKGEVHFEGAVFPYDDFQAVRGSVAWGFVNHGAISASIDPYRKHSQAMVGTFWPVGERFVWELYAGYGRMSGREYGYSWGDGPDGTCVIGKYGVGFVQANAGWVNLCKFMNIDLAFGLKVGGINGMTTYQGKGHYDSSLGVTVYPREKLFMASEC